MSPSMQCDLDAIEALLYAYHEGLLNFPKEEVGFDRAVDWLYNESIYKVYLNRGFCSYIYHNCSAGLEDAFNEWVKDKGLHPDYPFGGEGLYKRTRNKWEDHEAGRTRIAYIEEFVQHYFGEYL